jgi:chromosome segregation ATPase
MATAGKVTVLTVTEESIRQESVALVPAGIPQLLSYTRTGEIPQNVRDAIAKAVQLKQGITDIDRQIAERTTQISAIAVEQERIRENMKTVEQKSQYYERLLSKLNAQESTIERLQKDRDDLNAARDGQQKALEDYLNGLIIG